MVLYEASYIGNPRCFTTHLIAAIWTVWVLIGVIHILKKMRAKEEQNYQDILFFIAILILGLSSLADAGRLLSEYRDIILRYKEGKYREVEGIVEDYTDHKNSDTFTVNGVEFEISTVFFTWGYTYWNGKNVITGDGQHLKIRYIPGSNSIVYIEEIVEEKQQSAQEETELIHKILSEDKEEFQEFLTTDWDFPHEQEAIEILTYDFTKDGKDEVIVSKFYLNTSAVLTYNYVYNQDGKRIMEFVGGHPLEMQIIDDWDGEGTFLIYTMNHYAAHYNADIYTEIRCEDDVWTEKVVLMELDRRYGGDEGKEEYYIFKDFTKEEEEKLWYGGSGVDELTKTKACFKEGGEPEEYRRLFEENETAGFSIISVILYSEKDGFVEY